MILLALVLASTSAQALDFSRVLLCDSSSNNPKKEGPWCLNERFPKDRKVAFLERKNCKALTGEPHHIQTEVDSHEGTVLTEFSCPDATAQDQVVLDVVVSEYRKLKISSVLPPNAHPATLDHKIRAMDGFKVYSAKRVGQATIQPKSLNMILREVSRSSAKHKRTYVATYTEDGRFPFLVSKTIVPLADDSGTINTSLDAFRLNDQDVLVAGFCYAETDACWIKHIEL